MKGRKPKAGSVLELEKGKLYDEQRDRQELTPAPREELIPRCPARFSKDEKREWRYVKRILENYGLFSIANAVTLEMLATNRVLYKECAADVADRGMILKKGKSLEKYNPYWTAQQKLEAQINRNLQDLGLTTTGMAKIGSLSLKAKKQKEGMEALLD